MRARLVVSAVLIGALSLFASGCDRLTEAFTPEPTIVTREATVAVPAALVQGSFQYETPEGLPIWPDAKVISEKQAKGSKSWDEMILTADTYEVVLAGMTTGLEKAGWEFETIDASTPEAPTTLLNVSRNGIEGVITVAATPEGTTIGYVIAKPE